jgi:hypothetical protein
MGMSWRLLFPLPLNAEMLLPKPIDDIWEENA